WIRDGPAYPPACAVATVRTSMSRVDGCGGRHPRRVPSPDGGGHTTFVGRTGGPRYGAAVPTRLRPVVLAATDPPSLARFWSVATGWPAEADASGVVAVEPPAGSHEPGIPLVFIPNADPKAGKNRVHLDLNTRSADDQAATVERLRAAGARPVDIGQRDVPWVVLADPEGNELCVLTPRG